MFPCPYCSGFVGRSFKKLLSHIKFIHSHEPNFSITCGNCGQSFRKFNSFKSHIHREQMKNDLVLLPVLGQEGGEADLSLDDSVEDQRDSGDEESEDTSVDCVDDMTRFLGLFILKTKEENQLSQIAINAILENTGDLVERSLQTMKDKIVNCIENSGIEIANIEGLTEVLEQQSIYCQAKQRLQNEHLQLQYFLKNFNFVVCIVKQIMIPNYNNTCNIKIDIMCLQEL